MGRPAFRPGREECDSGPGRREVCNATGEGGTWTAGLRRKCPEGGQFEKFNPIISHQRASAQQDAITKPHFTEQVLRGAQRIDTNSTPIPRTLELSGYQIKFCFQTHFSIQLRIYLSNLEQILHSQATPSRPAWLLCSGLCTHHTWLGCLNAFSCALS